MTAGTTRIPARVLKKIAAGMRTRLPQCSNLIRIESFCRDRWRRADRFFTLLDRTIWAPAGAAGRDEDTGRQEQHCCPEQPLSPSLPLCPPVNTCFDPVGQQCLKTVRGSHIVKNSTIPAGCLCLRANAGHFCLAFVIVPKIRLNPHCTIRQEALDASLTTPS